MTLQSVFIRHKGLCEYLPTWSLMQSFTQSRTNETTDEIWFLEHFPVFTLGQNGKPEHLLHPGDIPILKVDRGGQVTYHGPGQLMVYTLVDLKRKKFNTREFVTHLENSIIQFLDDFKIKSVAKREAPGIYVFEKKICSIGLRIRRGCTYHGLALNINLDLEPFSRINPCGFPTLEMTKLSEWVDSSDSKDLQQKLLKHLMYNLGYTTATFEDGSRYGN